jgi:gamma-glutamyl hercynylcysteine S-oxide hydrolase
VCHRLRAGADPATTMAAVATEVAAAAPGSRLNLLLTDGAAIWATSWGHALSVRTDEETALVASEPFDADPGWRPVPDQHLVVAEPGKHRCIPVAVPTSPPTAPAPAPDATPTTQGAR